MDDTLASYIEKYYPQIIQMGRSMARGTEFDPEDIAHTAIALVISRVTDEGPYTKDAQYFLNLIRYVMRNILFDWIRYRNRRTLVDFEVLTKLPCPHGTDIISILDLQKALNELEQIDSETANVFQLYFWLGMTINEVAELAEISPATVKRRLSFSRAFLLARKI